MRTLLLVAGTRPQFIKAAAVWPAFAGRFAPLLVHTGQHYDHGLSGAFFEELSLPEPARNLGIGSAGHGEQIRRMTAALRTTFRELSPAGVLVFGDTNSTLAGSLAAAAEGLPLVHLEAGLRSGVLRMAEEGNRIVADHLADLCLCPTASALAALRAEGIGDHARFTGDVMLDLSLRARGSAGDDALRTLGLAPREYCFATVHRAENADSPARLSAIVDGLSRARREVVFALHPRTAQALRAGGLAPPAGIRVTPPRSYLETLSLVAHAAAVATDSGGLQKEAFFLGVPCVTLRDETEWPETLQDGWNTLAGVSPEAIAEGLRRAAPAAAPDLSAFGGGTGGQRAADAIAELLGEA